MTHKFVIITSHVTKHIIPSFMFLFNKYVSKNEEVILLGNYNLDIELQDNFTYTKRCNEDEPISNWSKTIHDKLQDIDCDYIILGLDDFLPVSNFNYSIFNNLKHFMDSNSRIVRTGLGVDIFHDYKNTILKQEDGYNIIEQCQGENYRCSTQFAIWRKDFLIEKTRIPRSPWDFENIGSNESRYDGNIVAGTSGDYCWRWIEYSAVSQRYPGKINVLGLKLDVIKELVNEGFVREEDLQFGMYTGRVAPYIPYKDTFNMDILNQYTSGGQEFEKLYLKYKINY